MTDNEALAALIAQLYRQVLALSAENEQLRQQLTELTTDDGT